MVKTVRFFAGTHEVGSIDVTLEDDGTAPISAAAVAYAALTTLRVDGEEFTVDEAKEWWA